eukprot:TRINITY_DN23496_c0_g1_i1.p1 TRINITY_DN23496_c0_g1~~TRINITY_DN23496_c0_g1_i1.p1  ORF type:complete len:509 (+),score=153.10 TRINITY_DN23496_c0_g1_i1:94-1527(+)
MRLGRAAAVHGTRRAPRRGASSAATTPEGSKAVVALPDEDEFGRPSGCPPGLTKEQLHPRREFWVPRLQAWRGFDPTDRVGRRQLRTRKSANEPYWNPNPDVSPEDPLTLRNVAGRVPFPNVNPDPIEVPVFNMQKQQVGTRKLDQYVFGCVPEANSMFVGTNWEMCQRLGYGGWFEYNRQEAPGVKGHFIDHLFGPGQSKQKWQGNLGTVEQVSGAQRFPPTRWRDRRFDIGPLKQSEVLRMALSLKLLKERLIVVDEIRFAAPSVEVVRDWAHAWGFDRDRLMAYIIDGGTKWAPTQEMDRNSFWTNIFVYGLQVQEPRSLNMYDTLKYHYLVLTEGALEQIERFFDPEKAMRLPPHVRNKMTHQLAELGEKEWEWTTVEEEGAWEVAKMDEKTLDGYRDLDDPWLNGKRWDENERRVQQHRVFVSNHLPREGDPINDDMRDYWRTQNVNMPRDPESPPMAEYGSPQQVLRRSRG